MHDGFSWLALVVLLGTGCGDDGAPPPDGGGMDADLDADTDAGGPDAGPLPEGIRGDILRVPEEARVTVPELSAPVYVLYDDIGVPFVFAENDRDLYIVQGFVTTRDRYFFFDAGSRLGQARLSEFLGDAALPTDIRNRNQGQPAVAARLLSLMDDAAVARLEAYTDGANAYVDGARELTQPLPSELRVIAPVLGDRPQNLMRHFTPADVAGLGTVITYIQSFSSLDVARQQALDAIDAAIADAPDEALRRAGLVDDILFGFEPVWDDATTTGFGLRTGGMGGPGLDPARRPRPPARGEGRAVVYEREMLDRLMRGLDAFQRDQMLGGERGADVGSNEWAVMGSATSDGAAILAGDGHLPIGIPPIFHQIGLDTSVFGGGDRTERGVAFAGIPLTVGTNGKVAWTITYYDGDQTDWYAERVVLDDDGAPSATVFEDGTMPIRRIDEEYEIRDVPTLGSEGRTAIVPRYETWDGRRLVAIEGREVPAGYVPGPGETVVNLMGEPIVPEDRDGDDVVSGITLDFTGFEVGANLAIAQSLTDSEDVFEMRERMRGLVGFGQNVMAADRDGNVFYNGGYNGTPCREYLPRDADGFVEGADPMLLIDGTRFRGFEIPTDADGIPIEGDPDPYRCVVPFDEWPMAINPGEGYLVNANNDSAGLAIDGDVTNDDYYLGGPFAIGFRAHTIGERLAELTAADEADLDSTRELQNDHRLPLPRRVGQLFLDAIARAAELAGEADRTEAEDRLVALYEAEPDAMDEVRSRLQGWLDGGCIADSGVETFYDAPGEAERRNAVATSIWHAWVTGFFGEVFGDERVGLGLWFASGSGNDAIGRALVRILEGRGADNPAALASWSPATEESVWFDDRRTAVVETSDEMLLAGLSAGLSALRAPPSAPGVGGYGTDDMDAWLWGLRHMLRLPSLLVAFAGDIEEAALLGGSVAITTGRLPLADDIGDDDPRAGLMHFPRPGGRWSVDPAATLIAGGQDLTYAYGPAFRMVYALSEDRVRGVNILPGGQSGIADTPHHADQAALWIGNQVRPIHYHPEEVAAAAVRRETFVP